MKSTQSPHFSVLSSLGFVTLIALSISIKASLVNSMATPKLSESIVNLESNQLAIKGQVVESGSYHFELVPEKSNKGFHLDLFLLKGDNHKAVPNAKVTGQVQLPDGKQKNLTFTYDDKEKHYTALLTEKILGQYQLKVTADINGKKINARFSFK
jgi:hypothetical protein